MGDTIADPSVAFAPDHAPEAVQVVAFCAAQLSVLLTPAVIDVGVAVNVSVGAGAGSSTVTVTVLEIDPLSPTQVST